MTEDLNLDMFRNAMNVVPRICEIIIDFGMATKR